jgi:hypothetical protein
MLSELVLRIRLFVVVPDHRDFDVLNRTMIEVVVLVVRQ